MVKNILKRTLSTVLVLMLVATTFFIFDPSAVFTTAEAAVTPTNNNPTDAVTFVVPEVIYLLPVYNSYKASTTSSFKYYANDTSSWGVTTGEPTTGNIYFYYKNTSSAAISFTWESTPGTALSSTSTITFGNTSAKAPGTAYTVSPNASQAISITAGSSPSLAASTSGCYICWKAVFTDSVDGLEKTAYAYSYVYKPYPMPVASAVTIQNTRGDNHYAGSIGFISGIHGMYEARDKYPQVNTSNGLVTISGGGAGGSSTDASKLCGSYFTDSASNNNPSGWVGGSSSVSDATAHYLDGGDSNSTSGDEYSYAEGIGGYGKITVDSSRYTNLNQIPMLTVGSFVTDDESSGSGAAHFAANVSSFAHDSDFHDYWDTSNNTGWTWWDNAYNNRFVGIGSRSDLGGSESEGVKFNRHWTKATPSNGTVNKVVVGYLNRQGSDRALNLHNLRVYSYVWSKSDLRTAYANGIKAMSRANSTLLKSAKWTEYFNLFKAVAAQLCKVDQTSYSSVTVNGTSYSSASALATAMNNAASNYVTQNTTYRDQYTGTQYNIKVYDSSGWKYNGKFDNSTATYYKGAKVVVSGNSYAGYTYKGYRTAAESQTTVGSASSGTASNVTSGSYTVEHATGAVTCYSYYLREQYTLTYAANGGTTITALSYNVESTNTLPAASGKTGYTFSTWKCTTAGGSWTANTTYNSGTSVNGKTGSATLTAQWTANTYTVTLNQQSGSGGTTSVTATYDSAMPTTNVTMPTRTGYTFGGYYDNTGGSGTQYYTAAGASARTWNKTSNTTLYAKWTTVSYTIGYTLNGGALASGVTNPTSYTVETAAFTLNNPSRTGYTFKGWTGANGTTAQTTVKVTPGGGTTSGLTNVHANLTFTANWSTVSYTITYDYAGGSLASGVTNPATYTIETATFTLNNPSKGGYTFSGWTGSNGGTASTSVSIANGSYGNKNYTANWSANLYTITYDANGGTAKSALNYRPSDSVTLGDTTKTGYTFSSWKVTSASAGSWTQNSTYASNLSVSGKWGSVTMQAQWTPTSYSISYNYDGGSVSTANPTSYTIETTTFTLNNPTKTGYTFAGYTGTGLSSASTSVTVAKGSYGNRSYTATWTLNTYTISYTMNGGTNSSSNPSSYTYTTAAITLADATRTGYTFTGWTGNGTTTPTKNLVLPTHSTGNKTFTANWSAITYTMTFNENGGTWNGWNSDGSSASAYADTKAKNVKYDGTYGEAVASNKKWPKNPTRTGYDFQNWTADGTSSGKVYASGGTVNETANFTVKAYWTVHTYTISYTLNGGSNNANNPTSYKITDSAITLADATKTGYTFLGWTGNGTTTATKNLVLPAGSSGNKTFTANWSATSYSITYTMNGGSLASGVTNPTSYTVETAAFTLNNPSRTGYTFLGWTGSNGSTASDSVTVTPGTGTTNGLVNVRSNLSFTANFSVQSYTLTFIPNSGTFKATNGFTANSSNQTKSITYGSTYGASDGSKTWPEIERTGYTFGGWKNGSTTYTATTTVSVTAGHNVTAQWSATSYSISINYAGGSVSTANPTSYTIESAAITLNQPTRTGYTFAGYTGTGLSQATKSVTIPAGSTGNRSYTATWTTVSYTITYSLPSGATNAAGNPSSYTIESSAITLADASKTGWTFTGWTGNGTTTPTKNLVLPAGSTGNKTFTANFTANKYTVTFDKQSGSGGSDSVQATYDSAMPSATMPTRTGYTFGGYYTEVEGGGTQYYTAAGASARTWNIADNTKLYAKWTINTSKLTVKPNGGTWNNSGNDQSFTQNYNTTKTIADPSRTGYTFTGWTLGGDSNGSFNASTKVYTFGQYSGKTDTLTAGWTAVKYTITYDYKGGSVETANPTEYYVTTADFTLTQPTRTGYTFAGYTGTGLSTATTVVTVTQGSTGNRSYTATWTANTQTLTFNANSGSFSAAGGFSAGTANQSKTVTYGSTYGAADANGKTWPTVTRTGYNFSAWKDGNTTYAESGTVNITSNKTVSAVWTAIPYTITCNLNGGSLATANPATYTIESADITLNQPTRTGYTFTGWTGDNGNTAQKIVTITHGSTGNKTYNANWATISYSITYDLDGGSLQNNQTNPSNYTIETATFTLKNPAKTGYAFLGWTGTGLSSASKTVQIPLGSTGNRSYTATWSANKYTVTFNMQEGSGGTESIEVTYDAAMPAITLPARSGYGFAGYYTAVNGGGTDYYDANGDSVRNWNIAGDTTLYAKWTPTGYTITFDPKGGAAVYTNNKLSYNITSTARLVSTTRNGYTFSGWKPNANAGNWKTTDEAYAGGDGTTTGFLLTGKWGNVTLNAQWTVVKYTITYDSDGGDSTPAAQDYYITTNLTLADDPGKTGYTFDGWLPASAVGNWSLTAGNYDGSIGSGKWGNVTLVAQWVANEYTLTFNPNGGSVAASGGFPAFSGTTTQSKTVIYGKTYGYKYSADENKTWPNNPTKEGYDFGGWKNGGTTFTSGGTVTITDDTTITAEWNIQSYNVTVQTANSGTATTGYATASVQSGLTNGKAQYHATVTLQYTASAGYEFVNWTSSDVTVNSSNAFTMPAKAVTVTANFKPTTYTISYNLDNGALPSGQTNPANYTIETATFTLKNPERTGYEFAGWRVTNSADTPTTTMKIVKGTTGNLSFTAVWTAKQYSVTLDRQGGTTGATGVTATYGAAMPSTTMPTRDGYDFAGYYAQTGGQGTKYYNANGTSAHVWDVAGASTIYANWTVKTYSITYNYLYNSTVSPANPTSYKITDADITLNNPTRTGYNFTGWTGTGLANVTTTVVIESGSYGDRTYNANWSLINYTITYDLDDGQLGSGKTNPATYTIESEAITLNNPSKNGYTFTGWKGGVVGQTPTTSATVTIASGSTGNRSYTAQYSPRSYKLYFESDGDDQDIPELPYKPTDDVPLGDTTKEGYDFAGWMVISTTGTPNAWTVNSVYSADTSVKGKYGNATLEAQWTIQSYTLTVDPTGGTFDGTTAPSNYTNEYNYTKTLGTASRTGYEFQGWTKVSGAGTYTPNANPKTGGTFTYGASNARLEAQWVASTYTITYSYGVGAGSVTNPTSYTIETPTFTLNNPSKDGYTFNGWTGTNLNGTVLTVRITQGSTGNKTFTAQFSKNVYTVTLDRQGGTGGSPDVAATYNEVMPSAVMPTRTGYTFQGYYAQENGVGTKYYNENGSSAGVWDQTQDSTIYAYWTADSHTLTFVPNGGYFDVDETNNGGGFETGEDKISYQTKQVTFGEHYGDADASGKTWPAQMTYVGHTFAGWQDSNGTTYVKTGTVSITTDTILTAQWTKKTFTVAFNMNGVSATVSPASKTLSYGTSNTYAPAPTKTDAHDAWTFRGWSTNANTTTGTVASGGSQISAQTVNGWFNDVGEGGTKTVYAIWQKTLRATFRDGQGDDQVSTVLIHNGAASGDVAVKAQRDYSGWTKKGWTTSTSNTATADNTSTKFTVTASTITDTNTTVMYYGRYDRTVAVTYDANGGSTTPNPTSVTQQVNGYNITDWTNKTVTLAPAITRGGYTFAGWEIGGTVYDAEATYTITGNVTATAQWDLSNFTVKIDPNEGSVSSIRYYSTGTTNADIAEETDVTDTVDLTAVHGTTMTLELPERNGYTFDGWTVTATDGGALPADGAITNSSVAASTYVVGAADVTLTAEWTAKTYNLRYASNMEDGLEIVEGTYAYDETVEIADVDVLETDYPGYTFSTWTIGFDENGDTRAPGDEFTLSDFDVAFGDLEVDETGRTTVYMMAEWNTANYQIAYDTNGYAVSSIKSAGQSNTWRWQDYAVGDYLQKGGDVIVTLSGAYSDETFGLGSYYYLSTATEVRFGLGWSFDSTATEPDIPFLSDLTIGDISDDVLRSAELVDEGENLYEIKLYMVWSANYKPFEDEVALFQHTYMTFPETGNTTLRRGTYTGANAANAVYVNAPQSGRLPAVSMADAAYVAGGSEALELWDNNSAAPDYATYAWVAGQIGNENSWVSHNGDEENDFTARSLQNVNNRIRQVMGLVITDPTAQYSSIISQAAEDENETLASAAEHLNDAVTAPQSSYLLTGLALKDADLDYRLTLEEMQAFDTEAYTYSEGCASEENEGLSYRPDEETVGFMSGVFEEELNEMYPDCETVEDEEGVQRHHSFNSLADAEIGYANEIFAAYGFDATQPRDSSADYFMDGTLLGLDVDSEGYVINPDSAYTTKSVYKLFDLIYGTKLESGTWKSNVSGGINVGNVALYYQVKDAVGTGAAVKLKKPSQEKLNKVVTILSYGYHCLEMNKADYTEFEGLFQAYFDATWGVRLSEAGYSLGTNSLSSYEGYFTEDSFARLSAFMTMHFSAPGALLSTYEKRPAVEQAMVNGKSAAMEEGGWARSYKNEYVDESEVDLSAFNFAESTKMNFADRCVYDEEEGKWVVEDLSGTTLCSLYCDAIDALVPATADYTAVFALIANNVQRQTESDTFMVDPRTYTTPAERSAFYPSTAAQINQGSNYETWRTEYAKTNAWTSTRENGKPAYDVDWLNRYYTASSVTALRNVLRRIVWGYNKLDQALIDGMTNGSYNDGTICKNLKTAIDNLTPKVYEIEFYKGLTDPDDPEYNAKDYVGNTTFYFSGNIRKEYRFGDTVNFTQVADPYNMKTFNGWNTLRNNLGSNVSVASDLYRANFVLDETLLGTPETPNTTTADISTTNNRVYTIKLYAEWVDNITLDIVMNGGTATVTPSDTSVEAFTVTDTAGNRPSFNYRTTLTFSNMQKTGYQFDHWTFQTGQNNTASGFNTETNVYTFGYRTGAQTYDTLTANWTKNTYTVTFHENYTGSTRTATQTFRYDTAQALTLFSATGFARTGWRFTNWTDANNVEYTDGQSVNNLTAEQNGNVDLYAQWEVADFTLTFRNDFTLPDWYDEDLGTFTWATWAGAEAANADLTKTITSYELFGKADAEGKTWPSDPVITYEIVDNVTVTVTFEGWYTQKDSGGTKIEAGSTVSAMNDVDLYPHFSFARTQAEKAALEVPLVYMNANDYTMESMQYVDEWLQVILAEDYEVTEDDLVELQRRMDLLEEVSDEDGDQPGDTTPPVVSMYENKAALQAAIANGTFHGDQEDIDYMLSEETGETGYVFPGKAYYTYYCYTNSAAPAIMLSASEVLGDSGRVSYPVTFSMDETGTNAKNQVRTRSGLVGNGWMNYSQDVTDPEAAGYNPNRTAGYHIGTNDLANPYRNDLTYFGMNYDGTGYEHYMYEQYILLKPTFDTSYVGKQYALYTFEVKDDSVGDLTAATSTLAGAANTSSATADLTTTSNEDVTPANTITIFVEYYNTMNGYDGDAGGQVVNASGVGTYNGSALEVYNNFHENGVENNVWVNKDFLYRNAAGATNDDFITPAFITDSGTYNARYLANDPVYGQTDVGSFYYLMKSSDAATTMYWEAYDQYIIDHPNDEDAYHNARVAGANAALAAMKSKVEKDMQNEAIRAKMNSTFTQGARVENGDYIYWPYTTNTKWSTQFYAPARTREDTLVYVHIYDRWGNHYTNILQRDLQDTQEAVATQTAAGDEVVVNETGGGGIKNISICTLNTKNKVTVSGMTAEYGWDSPTNQMTISGLEPNTMYTMWITDNAGNGTEDDATGYNFQTNADGKVTITVNDETMGGAYADAANGAVNTENGGDPDLNGVRIGAIEESALTTLTIEEVSEDAILADTIPETQITGESAAERPDVYTFTLNDDYTVNLFADATIDYDVTLQTTTGGTMKAYVDGKYAAPQDGRITVPAGSNLQIRLATNSGYELQSLTMTYANGKTVDLFGAYSAKIDDNVTIKATFVPTDSLLTIRVENGAVSGKAEMKVSPFSRVTAVADTAPDGKVFAYWTQNGADVPVSYDSMFTFIATSDVNLTAVYSDEPVDKTANIVMNTANASQVTLVNGKYTLAYSGLVTLPDDAEIEEFGMVLTNQSADSCTAENFVIGGKVNGKNVAKIVGQTITDGQIMINVNNVANGQTRTGRLYMTVKLADGSTQTIYSGTWTELNTPAA